MGSAAVVRIAARAPATAWGLNLPDTDLARCPAGCGSMLDLRDDVARELAGREGRESSEVFDDRCG